VDGKKFKEVIKMGRISLAVNVGDIVEAKVQVPLVTSSL